MTTVTATLSLDCPLARVRQYVRDGFELTADSGAKIRVECVPVGGTMNGPWRITWPPEAGGTGALFQGHLTARLSASDDTTILELQGELPTEAADELVIDLAAEMRARYAYEQALASFGNPPDPSPA